MELRQQLFILLLPPQVTPAGGPDFWQSTYYDPPISKSDGHAVLYELPKGLTQWSATTQFTLKPVNQFDQAGIIVFIDALHWLKAGVESVDGHPKMSCVVTDGHSDWSTQPWSSAEHVWMRVSYIRQSFVVECKLDEDWEFIRITPRMFSNDAAVKVGVYCCAPTRKGMQSTFHSLTVSNNVTFKHHT